MVIGHRALCICLAICFGTRFLAIICLAQYCLVCEHKTGGAHEFAHCQNVEHIRIDQGRVGNLLEKVEDRDCKRVSAIVETHYILTVVSFVVKSGTIRWKDNHHHCHWYQIWAISSSICSTRYHQVLIAAMTTAKASGL